MRPRALFTLPAVRRRRLGMRAALVALALPLAVPVALTPASPAAAQDCVRLVIEGRELGGTSVQCLDPGSDGIALLRSGGHTVRLDGSGLVCAIDGRPATGCGEPAPGGGYRFWSYWTASGSCSWSFSNRGPASRTFSSRPAADGWVWVDGGGQTSRPPSSAACATSPIADRYAADARLRSVLGAPVGAEQSDAAGRWQVYERGRIYWSQATGARAVYGAILNSYLAAGGHSRLGLPTTDELPTADGSGRFNHFANGASVYWTPSTGAHAVYGAIRARWVATGGERGPLGYPTTSETGTPDGVGRFNHFSRGGSVYWTPSTGAREVYGAIRARWASLGWERGYLGYPTSGEYAVPGGRRSDFRGGWITWTPSGGAMAYRR